MSSSKRKRASSDVAGSSPKKVAFAHPVSENVKVSVLTHSDEWDPVIAQTPGLSLSPLTFKPYTSINRSSQPSSLHLHSSSLPKLDYSAQGTFNGHLKHYLAVFDPSTSTLQLIPSKQLTVRAIPRASSQTISSTATKTATSSSPSKYRASQARQALGLAFGTKKSQKAIRSLTQNALSPSKQKPSRSSAKLADAVLSQMPTDGLTREDLQTEADAAKPRPKANTDAKTPSEVYSIADLVGGKEGLRLMNVKEWIDVVDAGGEVLVKSRFVAERVEPVIQSGDIRKLKGLRYLLLLIEFFQALKSGRVSGSERKVPKDEELAKKLPTWNSAQISAVRDRFRSEHMPPGILNSFSVTLLLTTIFALTLCIDNQTTDTLAIKEDLKLEQKQVNTLMQELGATVGPPTETERTRMGWGKTEAKVHLMAKLRLPLVWPKLRLGVVKGRR